MSESDNQPENDFARDMIWHQELFSLIFPSRGMLSLNPWDDTPRWMAVLIFSNTPSVFSDTNPSW
tara:strand:- start:62 stop:256 length:195 start_codon:yes stop_codon:yes gene_type:complete